MFRWVRHPFYTAYILCYSTVAVASGVTALAIGAVGLIVVYSLAAVGEERGLLAGPQAGAYRKYRRQTGRFLPRPMTFEASQTK